MLVVVDLGALQFVGVVNVDGFPFREKVEGRDRRFTVAIAGLLGATKREMRFCADGGGIDIDDAGVEITEGGEGGVDIAGVDGSREAVGDFVGHGNSLLQMVDGHDRDDRAEDLFLSDAHLWLAIAEYGRFVEPTFGVGTVVEAVTAGEQFGSLLDTNLNVTHHRLQLLLVDDRTHVRRGVEAVADRQFLGAFHEAPEKLLINGLVDADTARGGAALAAGAKAAPDGTVDGDVEVSVVQNENDIFTAHFE